MGFRVAEGRARKQVPCPGRTTAPWEPAPDAGDAFHGAGIACRHALFPRTSRHRTCPLEPRYEPPCAPTASAMWSAVSRRERSTGGSPRRSSARAPDLELKEISYAISLYSWDYDDYLPVARAGGDRRGRWRALRHPEYNRSIPGALKNAIDWASRPYGQNAFNLKPGGHRRVDGQIGTAVGQQHLRSI